MNNYERLCKKEAQLSLIGLGYVGMPIAVAFSQKVKVIGFDVNEDKVNLYKQGIDPTKEVGNDVVKNCNVNFTSDEKALKDSIFHIVAVPTPVKSDHTPELRPVISASHTVGRNLTKGSIVVYESTVYPGVTEEICIPILEAESGLKCGLDFKVGYSPERINPSDEVHKLNNITKIVSACDEEALEEIAKVYELVVEVGVYKAESIKVAEAAKVIENSQRDINVAFMNELSIIFNKLGIDTQAVLKAAGTKWNFLNFYPGLVGGHCIGVDPYYLTYKAESVGYHSQIILSGRRINDEMGKYIAENTIKHLIKADINIKNSKIGILGFAFKENCPDTRNTKIIDIIDELKEYGVVPIVVDPVADMEEAKDLYGINLKPMSELVNLDALIIATQHHEFKNIKKQSFDSMFNDKRILIDVKGILDKHEYVSDGYIYWRL
ncbi:nucleotide sugar dehydrogenase [Clostridiaceae bacterium DONG20-135]|uniref:Nucleotide sugar dehydrogenase n=1 Tax=Copranaerobaculum intestinale TaxID=2692629 RepID=A0A6N8U478_9FIRM|nr:nucleotide sugar dehydrogenase [Copranaerobaculum intestinale]MXQ72770.1 nucleotide sugar dehydrogenase [Copranaerobaculum intestinale]